jgi:hypothetical protein
MSVQPLTLTVTLLPSIGGIKTDLPKVVMELPVAVSGLDLEYERLKKELSR